MPKAYKKKRRRLAPTPSSNPDEFARFLQTSNRVMVLCGAGLSASSGLPTFRGMGGHWRKYEVMELATFEAFKKNPVRVWQFYTYRRKEALNAKPNKAHYALAELARRKNCITVSQNVDGLSPRANHPDDKIFHIHGSLFTLRCESCDYAEPNLDDPVKPELAIPEDENAPLPDLSPEALPRCPSCEMLLRPGVVWFYEDPPQDDVKAVEDWMDLGRIDLFLVIGTSSSVDPAAKYSTMARDKGARVAVFNINRDDEPVGGMRKKDWFFKGDAAVLLPELLRSVVGEIDEDGAIVKPPSNPNNQ